MSHGFDVQTRTIHTIFITIPDDVMGQLEANEVEVILTSRAGSTLPKKLSYRDIRGLVEGEGRTR